MAQVGQTRHRQHTPLKYFQTILKMVGSEGLEPGKLRLPIFILRGLQVPVPEAGFMWWARRDLNPRPDRYERPALTN